MADQPGTVFFDPPASAPSNRDRLLSAIGSLLGHPISFYRRLVDLTGNVKAALLLSQSIYWTRRGRDIDRSGGWFHKTSEQWAWETGLSPKEQSHARDALKALALVDERRTGLPARLHFRLNTEQLGRALAERIAVDPRSVDWDDTAMAAEMLGPSVAYHRTLAAIAGGVHAGLMLSRALQLTRLPSRQPLDGWICSSAARWTEEIGLTRREQETARRDLVKAGVWEEALRGMPSSLVGRVRLDRLLSLLTDGAPPATAVGAAQPADQAEQAEQAEPSNPAAPPAPPAQSAHSAQVAQAAQVRVDTSGQVAQKNETGMAPPHSLVSPKPPSLFQPIRHQCFDESAISLIQWITSELPLQPPQNAAREATAPFRTAGCGGGDELIFPDRMQAEDRAAARQLLRQSGEQAQVLLDELAGRLQANGVRSSPVGYLRGLVNRAAAGSFVAEHASGIASERRQRQKAADECREREAEERRLEAERATPEYQARVRTEREKLSRLRDDLKRRLGQGPPR